MASMLPSVVVDGCVFAIDAANTKSYIGTGNTVNGLVGIGGTLYNGVGFTNTNAGSFVFDGTNDYFNSSTNVNITGSSPRTICVWVYVPFAQRKNVYGYGQGSNGSIFDIILWDSSGYNRVIGHYWGGGFDTLGSLPSRNTINVPGWNYIVHIYDGATVSLYTNAVFSNSANLTLTTLDSSLTIGKGTYNAYDYFTGSIGPLHIYNRALSATEILQNFNALRGRYGV